MDWGYDYRYGYGYNDYYTSGYIYKFLLGAGVVYFIFLFFNYYQDWDCDDYRSDYDMPRYRRKWVYSGRGYGYPYGSYYRSGYYDDYDQEYPSLLMRFNPRFRNYRRRGFYGARQWYDY